MGNGKSFKLIDGFLSFIDLCAHAHAHTTTENTHCILKEKDRCHFHNKDFKECINSRGYEKATLSDKFNSCVRQLLFDGESDQFWT